MNKGHLLVLVLAVIAGLAGFALSMKLSPQQDQPPAAETVVVGQLPDYSYTTLAGQAHNLATTGAKVVVLNFWATWCGPCVEEMPDLDQLQNRYKDKGLLVLGFTDDRLDAVKTFINQHGVHFPIHADTRVYSLGRDLGNQQGVLPYTLVADASGRIVFSKKGRLDMVQLEAILMPLLENQDS